MRPSTALLSICLWLGFVTAARAESIIIVADPWCPYNCEEDAKNQGYMIDIARAALAKGGVEVVYKTRPWSRAIEQTREGKFTAIIGATPEEAPDFIYPKTLQGFSTMRLWVRPDSNWQFKGPASLDKMKIGAIVDYSYSTLLDDYFQKHHKDRDRIQLLGGENALELNLRKLLAGRIDVLPEDKNVMHYYYQSRGQEVAVKEAGNPIDSAHVQDAFLFVGFGPKTPKAQHYANLLDKGVRELRASGELKAILDKYQVDDWYPITKK